MSSTGRANQSGGAPVFAQGFATAPVDGVGKTKAQGYYVAGTPSFSISSSFDSSAYATESPIGSTVTNLWTGQNNVINAFQNNAGDVQLLGQANMQRLSATSGASHTYSTVLDLNEANGTLSSGGLHAGMLARFSPTADFSPAIRCASASCDREPR